MKRKMQKLAELERKEEEETVRQRFEEQRITGEARRVKEVKQLEEMKKMAHEEYSVKAQEEETKKKRKKEDKIFQERMVATLTQAGYSDESIEKIIQGRGGKGNGKKIMDLTRPTYIKVHRKYLSADTLDIYEIPWEWDDVSILRNPLQAWSKTHNEQRDSNYIIIKRWIPKDDQDSLFEHTRKLREGRLLTNSMVETKKERDNLLLVRKKSPSRRRSRGTSGDEVDELLGEWTTLDMDLGPNRRSYVFT